MSAVRADEAIAKSVETRKTVQLNINSSPENEIAARGRLEEKSLSHRVEPGNWVRHYRGAGWSVEFVYTDWMGR